MEETQLLVHTSPDKADSLTVSSEGFGGVFCSRSYESGRGGWYQMAPCQAYCYEATVSEDDIMDTDVVWKIATAQVDYESYYDILAATIKSETSAETEDEIDSVIEALISHDSSDTNVELLSTYEFGEEYQWEIQRLIGCVAKKLGYKAAEMIDETGISVLLLAEATMKYTNPN